MQNHFSVDQLVPIGLTVFTAILKSFVSSTVLDSTLQNFEFHSTFLKLIISFSFLTEFVTTVVQILIFVSACHFTAQLLGGKATFIEFYNHWSLGLIFILLGVIYTFFYLESNYHTGEMPGSEMFDDFISKSKLTKLNIACQILFVLYGTRSMYIVHKLPLSHSILSILFPLIVYILFIELIF